MPEFQVFFRRLHHVVDEYRLTALAVERLKSAVGSNDVELPRPRDRGDLVRTAANLESTYLIRLWAEFETALLSYRRHVSGDSEERMPAKNLVEWTAALKRGRTVSVASRNLVHDVREYRNALVHERDNPAPRVEIEEARSRLNTLLAAKLPNHW